MKILLTGAAGQLGREMAPRLAPYGEVIGIDRAAVPGLGASLQQDLGDAAAVERLLGDVKPALIVNAAAPAAINSSTSAAAGRVAGSARALIVKSRSNRS